METRPAGRLLQPPGERGRWPGLQWYRGGDEKRFCSRLGRLLNSLHVGVRDGGIKDGATVSASAVGTEKAAGGAGWGGIRSCFRHAMLVDICVEIERAAGFPRLEVWREVGAGGVNLGAVGL